MTNREDFEVFWQDKTGCNGEYVQKDDNDKYYEKSSNEAWLVWQASAERYEARIAELEAQLAEAKKDAERLKELEKAICIYCREEVGTIHFESDKDALNYFIEYTNKFDEFLKGE